VAVRRTAVGNPVTPVPAADHEVLSEIDTVCDISREPAPATISPVLSKRKKILIPPPG
jgi:hypothetical protein